MASTAVPNSAVPSLLSPGWLTADKSAQVATGRVPVTQDDTDSLPNPQVPVSDGVVSDDWSDIGPGGVGEAWEPTTSFPWPATPPNGDGVVAVLPGSTGDGNDNDDPSGLPGYDGPLAKYRGAYAETAGQPGYDAVAQRTDSYGFNELTPGSNMGYQRQETRLIGNTAPGYVNVWSPIYTVTPPVKTANLFTAQPFTNSDGTEGSLPPYADLSLANSGGTAYYLDGPQAPAAQEATPVVGTEAIDPAAGWA